SVRPWVSLPSIFVFGRLAHAFVGLFRELSQFGLERVSHTRMQATGAFALSAPGGAVHVEEDEVEVRSGYQHERAAILAAVGRHASERAGEQCEVVAHAFEGVEVEHQLFSFRSICLTIANPMTASATKAQTSHGRSGRLCTTYVPSSSPASPAAARVVANRVARSRYSFVKNRNISPSLSAEVRR